ncbi:MAG: acyltransferase family protein [Planctomycetota bacterium]
MKAWPFQAVPLETTHLRYRADIDGLRGVAVMLVLLFHADIGFTGGYVGVDIFFVISGFLITGLIFARQQAGTFGLGDFWNRRIRRIFPASLAMTAITLLSGFFLLLPQDLTELAQSATAQFAMVSNVYFWRTSDYFAGAAETKPLLHTWSLAVEEQFYLGLPCILVVLNRFTRRVGLTVLLTLFASSFLLCQWGTVHHPTATFFLLPTRMWELLLGSLLAYANQGPGTSLKRDAWLAMIGLIAIVYAAIAFDSNTRFPGVNALIPCGGAVALIHGNRGQVSLIARALSWAPIRFVGLISYSLYLWHWPVLALLRYWLGTELAWPFAAVGLALSFLLALISWRFIEQPFRNGRRDLKTRTVVSCAIAASVLLLAACRWTVVRSGFPERIPTAVQSLIATNEIPREYEASLSSFAEDAIPRLGPFLPSTPLDFVVWGDSHAVTLGRFFDAQAHQFELRGAMLAHGGTLPTPNTWRAQSYDRAFDERAWNRAVLDWIRQHRPRLVILIARWAVNVEGRPNGAMDSLIVDEVDPEPSRQNAIGALDRGLAEIAESINSLETEILVVPQIPLQAKDPQKSLLRASFFGFSEVSGISLEEHQLRQSRVTQCLEKLEQRYDHVHILPIRDAFFDQLGWSRLGDSKGCYYCDRDHLSTHGAEQLLAAPFQSVFAKLREGH